MEKENLERLAITTATLIADISQKTVMSWKTEIEVQRNLSIHPSAFATLLLESSVFGHYYVGEKFKSHLKKEEDKKFFSSILHEKMIFTASLILETKKEDGSNDTHTNIIREVYEHFVYDLHESYSNYRSSSIVELFRERLRQAFNSCDEFKLKFIENDFKTRAMMKFGSFLAGQNNKYADNEFLDNKIIYHLADTLFSQFSALDYNQLSKNDF